MARAARSGLPILALGLAAALAACGSGSPATTPTPSSPAPTATVQPTPTPPPSATPTPAPTATATALAAIVIDKPAAGTTVQSPFHVIGTANTFEAVFRIEVQTPSGQVLSNQQVQATSGTGTRGTYDATVTVNHMGPVKLVAYEVSQKDGSRINQVSVDITIG